MIKKILNKRAREGLPPPKKTEFKGRCDLTDKLSRNLVVPIVPFVPHPHEGRCIDYKSKLTFDQLYVKQINYGQMELQ